MNSFGQMETSSKLIHFYGVGKDGKWTDMLICRDIVMS